MDLVGKVVQWLALLEVDVHFPGHVLPLSEGVHSSCGDSKRPVGVNVSVYGCLCLYVCPVMNWHSVQGVIPPVTQCQLGLVPAPHDPEKDKWC